MSALLHLQQLAESFQQIELQPGAHVENYNRVVGHLHQVISAILRCEAEAASKDDILQVLKEVRRIHSLSPFVHRCQTRPRGFAGDFETIEYLYYAVNKAPKESLPYYCEEFALLSPSTQQHRNKLQHQSRLVLELLARAPAGPPPRVLSLACGSALDLQLIASVLAPSPIEFVLNDTDAEALEYAQSKLSHLADRCQFMPGNVVEFLAWESDQIGRFDLILTGGLFDYLEDKHIGFVLKQARKFLLRPGGSFFFTNITPQNPYRALMEYLADWALIEREEEALMGLAVKAGFEPSQVSIQRDLTGLTCLGMASLVDGGIAIGGIV